jgi:energy-coupling factor transporter ATP-binding protein EcfA2
MSKILEICGAPGSGKTTTYNALQSLWKKDYNWSPTEFPQKKLKLNSLKLFISSLRQQIKGEKDVFVLDQAGERFVAQFPEYMDQFWNSNFFKANPDYKGVDLRFRNINVYWSTLRKIQYLRESKKDTIFIACEGLIQRIGNGWYKKLNLEQHKEEALALLNLMPLPEAVVYLQVDVKENVYRIQTRKKMLPAHKVLSEQELENVTRVNHEMWEFICGVISNKNIPLLKLNSGNDVHQNAQKIGEFANSLSNNKIASTEMSVV